MVYFAIRSTTASDLREGVRYSASMSSSDVVDERAHELNLLLGSGFRFHVLVELATFLRHPLNRIKQRHYESRWPFPF